MKIRGITITTAFLLAGIPALKSMAQYQYVPLPGQNQLRQSVALFSRTKGEKPQAPDIPKPTGDRQRLVRTLAEQGAPSGPFFTNWDMHYFNSGTRGSATSLHGPYTFSEYDSGYSHIHIAYAMQKFHNNGKLKQAVQYYDVSTWSGPGAFQCTVRRYDERGRLLTDSLRQGGQPGTNLALTRRYAYDVLDRLDYLAYSVVGYDPGTYQYSISIWKKYNDTTALPTSDSVIIIDNNVPSVKLVRHFYDINQLLIADSTYETSQFASLLTETTAYNYQNGAQTGLTQKLENDLWHPYSRITIRTDDLNRETLNETEYYENNTWTKYYRMERQYTYNSQPDSLPTLQFNYLGNSENGWFLNSKERRTFDASLRIDTLYTYATNTGVVTPYTYPSFTAFRYNSYGNISQHYTHNFTENFIEVNGYYTNYYYEVYDDPLHIGDHLKKNPDMLLYPNPATDLLYISFPGEKFNAIKLTLADVTGKIVMTATVPEGRQTINISNLATGLYFLKATDIVNGNCSQNKIMKQ